MEPCDMAAEGSADPGGHRNRSGPISSIGLAKANRLRGRSLSSVATQSRCSSLCWDRSVPFGKYCRSSPLDAPMFVNLVAAAGSDVMATAG